METQDKVEKIQRLLIETLSYLLKTKYPDDPLRLARCMLLFPEIRSLAAFVIKDKEQFMGRFKFAPLFTCKCCLGGPMHDVDSIGTYDPYARIVNVLTR